MPHSKAAICCSIEEGASFDGKRALSKECQHFSSCAAIKNVNPRLHTDVQMLGTNVIYDWRAMCGLHSAVQLCAHDADSGRALAAREMPSKELKTQRAIDHERDREQQLMTSQKSSSFQQLQACTLHF
jgi:hypothetical protein